MNNDELKKYIDKRLAEFEELRVYVDKRFAELDRRIQADVGLARLDSGYWPTIPMAEAETGGFTYEEKFETVPLPPMEAEEPPPKKEEPVVATEETPLSRAECLQEASKSGKPFVEGGARSS